MKKIQVVTERWCCEYEDLVALPGAKRIIRGVVDFTYCKHCGQVHEYHRYLDAAGAMDWNYRPVKGRMHTQESA